MLQRAYHDERYITFPATKGGMMLNKATTYATRPTDSTIARWGISLAIETPCMTFICQLNIESA